MILIPCHFKHDMAACSRFANSVYTLGPVSLVREAKLFETIESRSYAPLLWSSYLFISDVLLLCHWNLLLWKGISRIVDKKLVLNLTLGYQYWNMTCRWASSARLFSLAFAIAEVGFENHMQRCCVTDVLGDGEGKAV
jgi:hypothetical protein